MAVNRRFVKLGNATNVVASSKSSFDIQIGNVSYFDFFLRCTIAGVEATAAQLIAMVGNVELRAGATQVHQILSGDYRRNARYYMGSRGYTNRDDGLIPIPLSPQSFMDQADLQDIFAVGTSDVGSMVINIDLLAASTIDSIEVYARRTFDLGAERPFGSHVRMTKFNTSSANVGVHEYNGLPFTNNERVALRALHIEQPAAVPLALVNEVSVVRNISDRVIDQIPRALFREMAFSQMRTPEDATGEMFVVDFGLANTLTSFFPMKGVTDFRLLIDWAAAPLNYTITAERIVDSLNA